MTRRLSHYAGPDTLRTDFSHELQVPNADPVADRELAYARKPSIGIDFQYQ